MRLFVTALNSGSNGNCYYVGNEDEAVLIDAGISCREIEKRMNRLNLNIKKVKAIFISHEHTDHIKGVDVLSKKHRLPVYITPHTLNNARVDTSNPYHCNLSSYVPVQIGNIQVTAFPKFHDAADPQSFIVRYKDLCVGVFTDIGTPCQHLIKHFKCCNAIFLEANYDDRMLDEGNYPYHLKHRIKSNKGHLSNKQALDLFLEHSSPSLSHVFLSHLSKENNNPQLVFNLFKSHARKVQIVLTSRHEEIPVFEIGKTVFQPYQVSLNF
jgi:phosphoribosyl 1,2-cyclic phosphodiesterase